jgi:tetratricopeptide (TPR) repeat protein
MGGLSDALGNHSESLKCFEIALQFASEKDYKSVCYNQAVALMKLGCFSDAASIIEYLIDEIPEDPKYVAERGYCALEMGYPEEALCYYEKAMELFKKSPTVEVGVCVYTGLCSSYLELDMKKEAVEIALEGLNKFADADPMLFHNAGAAFVNMGWYKEAKEVLQKGVEKFPGDEELKKFLNDVEEDDNPPEEGDILGLVLVVTAVLAHRKFGKRK